MRAKPGIFVAIVVMGVNFAAQAQTQTATPAPQGQPVPPPAGQPAPPPGQWPPPPYQQQPYPNWPPRQSNAPAPNGEYVAPLQQYTQPSYIPQSVALSGPRMITDWRPDMPIPPGYHPETRLRRGEIISGAITFGIPYIYSSLIAAVGSAAGESSKTRALWVPSLGPFIEISQSNSITLDYLLVIDGLVQGLGAGLLIHGMTSPRTV